MDDKYQRQSASNYYISQFYHLAVRRGLDADHLLKTAGLDPDIVDRPAERVETEGLALVVMAVWNNLQDESMSLSNSPIPRGSFYMMGRLTIQEPNLRRALAQAMRFYGMVTSAFRMELEIDGDRASLIFHMRNPELDANHLFAEINVMAWHRYSSWLIAEHIPLAEVYFAYPAPAHVGEYTYLFPGRHVFDAPHMGFSFHRKFLERSNVQNRGSLKAFINRCPMELFMHPKIDFTLSGDLQHFLKKRCPNGFPTIDCAADAFHMTKRTMIRKLKEEGTSYQKIKDLVRRDRAVYYLTRRGLLVGEVAEKVGFSDSAVFARAFKTWTGLSPREYRVNFSQGRTPEGPRDKPKFA
jgi:AraC-like DNA-binding protein